jgi:hypothetical protein
MIYQWKTEYASHGVDAQAAGERMEKIRKSKGLTPQNIVIDARSSSSPLHACFEWRDSVAAEKYRERQAAEIIRNIIVVVEDRKGDGHSVRAFVNVTTDEKREYTSISKAMSDTNLRQQVLGAALSELRAWRQKYSDLQELADILAAVDRMTVNSDKQTSPLGVAAKRA